MPKTIKFSRQFALKKDATKVVSELKRREFKNIKLGGEKGKWEVKATGEMLAFASFLRWEAKLNMERYIKEIQAETTESRHGVG